MDEATRTSSGNGKSLMKEPGERSGGGGEAVHRSPAWLALLRGRLHWAIGLGLVLGVGAATAVYLNVASMYRSTGLVEITPEIRPVLTQSESTGPIPLFNAYMDAQVERMQSAPILQRAIQSDTWQRAGGSSDSHALGDFSRQLDIGHDPASQTITITFESRKPVQAAAGVQAVIDSYRQSYGQDSAQEDARILGELQQRRERLSRELDTLHQQQQQLSGQYGVKGLAERYTQRLKDLSSVEFMLQQTNAQIQIWHNRSKTASDATGPGELNQLAVTYPQLDRLLRQKMVLESTISSDLQSGMGENHREVVRARASLAAVNSQVETYLRQAQAAGGGIAQSQTLPNGLVLTLSDLKARKQSLEQLYKQVQDDTRALAKRQTSTTRLSDDIKNTLDQLNLTNARIDQINTDPPMTNHIRVIAAGAEPTKPANGRKRIELAGMAGIAGFGLGVGAIMLLGLLDSRFRHVDDAEASLPAVRMLGILPTLPRQLTDAGQMAAAAHCVHHVRTMLQLGDRAGGRVFVVTSPAGGSGKTSLTTALGLSFAAAGSRTLLIDCDVIGGGLTRGLGATALRPLDHIIEEQGLLSDEQLDEGRRHAALMDVRLDEALKELGYIDEAERQRVRLLEEHSSMGLLEACHGGALEACVARTEMDNLFVLPLGAAMPHQVGSLSPKALRHLLNEARSCYDVVLVDTGPVLGSIEASMVAPEADQVVFVVSRGDQKGMVLKSLKQLQALGTDLAGIVFNHAMDDDVQHSTYASATSGVSRRPQRLARIEAVDAATSARLGPVGSAVACCGAINGVRAEAAADSSVGA